jgi:hypothetical protein
MPTLITQDAFEAELLLNLNLTMAIPPAFATLPVAQIPKKKLKQLTNGSSPNYPPSVTNI